MDMPETQTARRKTRRFFIFSERRTPIRRVSNNAVSGLASASVGIFDSHTMMPVALILAATSWIGFAILMVGKRSIHGLRYVEEENANLLPE